eukprot:2839742-Pleurochrysis_carterae.AAC.1
MRVSHWRGAPDFTDSEFGMAESDRRRDDDAAVKAIQSGFCRNASPTLPKEMEACLPFRRIPVSSLV